MDKIINESNFSMLAGKIDDRILESLREMGLAKPTEIQARSLPHLLEGQDLIGTAKTGSGKTLAFLIPVIQHLIKLEFSKKHGIGSIIISPTRELALQTFLVLKKLISNIDLTCSLIVGGEKKHKEEILIKKGVNIIVSTPGRLLDHLLNTKEFVCNNLQSLVVDEADKLLEAGFKKDITSIIKLLPKKRQTILFSATIDSKVENLARLALKSDPVAISIGNGQQSTVTGLEQGYYICPIEKRIPWLFKMLKKCKKQKVMVFFSSCKSVDFHYEFFRNHCHAPVTSIHGKQTQAKRKEAYNDFVIAQKGTLFCTDVAARGLDIPSVNWIIQYDPPTDPKEYIHRVGRTARGLNNYGKAVLLLTPEEEDFIVFLQRKNVPVDKYVFEELDSDINNMLQEVISTNGVMKTLARKAYLGYLRCYKNHPMKKVFSIDKLDLQRAALGFGFLQAPDVDFPHTPVTTGKRKTHEEHKKTKRKPLDVP